MRRARPTGKLIPVSPVKTTIHLPSHLDQVRLIASQGLTDDEMAVQFGVPKSLMEKWKAFYPSFKKAIEEGRADPDVAVTQALYKRAIGMTLKDEEQIETVDGRGLKRTKKYVTKKRLPPDVEAQKFWLTNRNKEKWKNRHNSEVEGKIKHEFEERKKLIDEVYQELLSTPPAAPNAVGNALQTLITKN